MDEEDLLDEFADPYTLQQTRLVRWLVEVVGYPFNQTWHTPPPVDHALLAAYWNHHDEWDLSPEAARQVIRDECGQ